MLCALAVGTRERSDADVDRAVVARERDGARLVEIGQRQVEVAGQQVAGAGREYAERGIRSAQRLGDRPNGPVPARRDDEGCAAPERLAGLGLAFLVFGGLEPEGLRPSGMG